MLWANSSLAYRLIHTHTHTHTHTHWVTQLTALPSLFGIVSLESDILGPGEELSLESLVVPHNQLDTLGYLLPYSVGDTNTANSSKIDGKHNYIHVQQWTIGPGKQDRVLLFQSISNKQPLCSKNKTSGYAHNVTRAITDHRIFKY